MSKHNEPRTPVAKLGIAPITSSIWANTSKEGEVWYTVTFQRYYRKDDGWKYTDSFSRDDLLTLAKLANQAHDAILELRVSESDSKATAAA